MKKLQNGIEEIKLLLLQTLQEKKQSLNLMDAIAQSLQEKKQAPILVNMLNLIQNNNSAF